jgi:hypothetical protein
MYVISLQGEIKACQGQIDLHSTVRFDSSVTTCFGGSLALPRTNQLILK